MRVLIYCAALVAFIATSALTLTSIIIPRWISYSADTPIGDMYISYGLHSRCTGMPHTHCEPFPRKEDCTHSDARFFCSMWRTVGFLMSLAMALQLVVIAAYVIVLSGGRQKREHGWKLLSILLLVNGMLQCAAMAIVSYLFDNDVRFFAGWRLDVSWILCTVSWSVGVILAGFLTISGVNTPNEGGYEAIRG